jgi:hypothetical protein
MLYLALEPVDRYGFSSLTDYQFVSQGNLSLLSLLYIYHYIQYLTDIVARLSHKCYYTGIARFIALCFLQIESFWQPCVEQV